jgi:hypothetical protein
MRCNMNGSGTILRIVRLGCRVRLKPLPAAQHRFFTIRVFVTRLASRHLDIFGRRLDREQQEDRFWPKMRQRKALNDPPKQMMAA